MKQSYDVAIVGAGIVGSFIAYELSRYHLKVALLDKESDAGLGTSCRNSGVLHAGFYYPTGSLKAKLCTEGNRMMRKLQEYLHFPLKSTGKLLVAFRKEEVEELYRLKEQGEANGVELEIVKKEGIEKLQPGVQAMMGMYSPNTAIFSPYGATIAAAETAARNGVDVLLQTEVKWVKKSSSFSIHTNRGALNARWLINSTGVLSDKFSSMMGVESYKIYPCRGEYYILDKKLAPILNMPIYPVPAKGVSGHLGVHITPTVEGPILIGPSAEYIEDPEDYSCTMPVLEKLFREGYKLWPHFTRKDIIRTFSGIRAKPIAPGESEFKDFHIKEDLPNFINLVGIESPGLTAAPAIAKMVKGIIENKERLTEKEDFDPYYRGVKRFDPLTEEEKEKLVKHNPNYGEIVCRCEKITKQEILDAINNPIGAKSLVGIKYRSRAMMGRCQGGYCLPKIVSIMEKEFGFKPSDFYLHKPESWMFGGRLR